MTWDCQGDAVAEIGGRFFGRGYPFTVTTVRSEMDIRDNNGHWSWSVRVGLWNDLEFHGSNRGKSAITSLDKQKMESITNDPTGLSAKPGKFRFVTEAGDSLTCEITDARQPHALVFRASRSGTAGHFITAEVVLHLHK